MPEAERIDVLLVTEFAPRHSGHGGHVYPFFLCEQLSAAGLRVKTLFVGDGAGYGRPYARGRDVVFIDWTRLGDLAVSTSARDWGRFLLGPLWQKLRGMRNSGNHREAAAGPRSPDPRPEIEAAVRALKPTMAIVNTPTLLGHFASSGHRGYRLAVLCHDVIHERTRLYAANGWPRDFQPLSADAEGQLLARADLAIAISDEDAAVFAHLAPATRTVTSLPPIYRREAAIETPLPPMQGRLRCGFIGSGGPPNVEAMHWLIDAWSTEAARLAGHELVVAGTVANGIARPLPAGVSVLGPVDSVETFYRDCHLALAIVLQGTGVKIKVLEALRYGRPVLTTLEGLRGFGAEALEVFPVVNSHAELAAFLEALSDVAALQALARRQREWAERCLDPARLMKPLLQEIAAGEPGPKGA